MADTALFTMVINFSPSMSVGSVPGCNSSCFLKQICKTFLIHYLNKLLNEASYKSYFLCIIYAFSIF